MDKIILAYCRENTDIAERIDQNLGRVGIPFEHLTNQPGAMPGQFTAWIQSTAAPVILLVTDNFLKNQNCMASGLTMLQQLVRTGRVLPLVADGKVDRHGDGQFEAVPTQFERVIHAIQYMNFWQSAYLELRAKTENAAESDMAQSEDRLKVVRDISNEVGEFLNLLRDADYVTMSRFEANDYELFFRKFGIMEWHEQYRKLAAFDMETPVWDAIAGQIAVPTASKSALAESPAFGSLVPAPDFDPASDMPRPEPEVREERPVPRPEALLQPTPSNGSNGSDFSSMDALIEEIVQEEQEIAPMPEAAAAPTQSWTEEDFESLFEEATAGLPNFENPATPHPPTGETEPVAIEKSSQFSGLQEEIREEASEAPSANGLNGHQEPVAFQEIPVVETLPTDWPAPEPFVPWQPEPAHKRSPEDIALTVKDAQFWMEKGHSDRALKILELAIEESPDSTMLQREYLLALAKTGQHESAIQQLEAKLLDGEPQAEVFDLLGEIALTQHDAQAARKHWEKAASLDPVFPGIYWKLGLLCDEQLKGQKKAAAEYLKIATEQQPENPEIHYRLATILLEHLSEPARAVRYLLNTVALQNEHPDAWFDLATAYREIGDLQKAETCYRRASGFKPALKSDINDRLFILPVVPPAPVPPKPVVFTVLITGATSGIGRATAEVFAQHGHRVILVGRREERLEELKSTFSKSYKNDNLVVALDVRNYQTVQASLENLPEDWRDIDILINNAGLAKGLDFIHEGNLEHWETMIDTNIKGLLYVTRCISPEMVRRKKGHIINIGSSAGKEAYARGGVYCATKFAVEALTKAMRLDLHTHNIRVSQVSPGHVEETEFALTRFDGDTERAKIYEDFQPLKASDVAEAIYFIATRPAHVNIQDIVMFASQQASATVINRNGRGEAQ